MEPYPAPATAVQQSSMDAMMNLKAYSNQDAPFEPPGDAPRLEPSLEPSVGHMDGVLAPGPISSGTIDVALQLLLQQGELQEQVVDVADAGRAPANLKGGRSWSSAPRLAVATHRS